MKTLYKKNKTKAGIITAALTIGLVLASTAQAGKIISVPSPATGAAGFGGWNLNNVEIIVNGTQGNPSDPDALNTSWFDELTGAYNFGLDSDLTYVGNVTGTDMDADTGELTIMGITLAKDWPVGEPSGIKIVNDDTAVKNGKPENCIMATSYLADHFLDSDDPQQVTCSGPFQSHKRYKLAMLPATVDGIGSESVDLVFNVEPEEGSRDYQVFQKINNWTDGRLEGFTIQVGFGIGEDFQATTETAVDISNLHVTVPHSIWKPNQLAVFSEGLFGPFDDHTETIGFFDPNQRAGFLIDEYIEDTTLPPLITDTLHATRTLGSDYAEIPPGSGVVGQFGPWLPNNMLPYGVFFDDDGNPETDAELLAWYGYNPVLLNDDGSLGGLGWMGGSQDSDGPFSAIPNNEIAEMGQNLSFTMGEIDDLVNVGLNYIVTVGNVIEYPDYNMVTNQATFTIRITPTPDSAGTPDPAYVGAEPEPLLLFTSSDAEVLLEPADEFVVGSLLTARVGDADLNQNLDPEALTEYVDILIRATDADGNVIIDVQELTLEEQGENRGVFAATLPEIFSHVPVGSTVAMGYIDEDTGETDANGNVISAVKFSFTEAIAAPEPILSDVSITTFDVPDTILDGRSRTLKVSIRNDNLAAEAATGVVRFTGRENVSGDEFEVPFSDLRPGGRLRLRFRWTAELADPTVAEQVNWTATVIINDQEIDTATATTQIDVKTGRNSIR